MASGMKTTEHRGHWNTDRTKETSQQGTAEQRTPRTRKPPIKETTEQGNHWTRKQPNTETTEQGDEWTSKGCVRVQAVRSRPETTLYIKIIKKTMNFLPQTSPKPLKMRSGGARGTISETHGLFNDLRAISERSLSDLGRLLGCFFQKNAIQKSFKFQHGFRIYFF